MPRKRSQKGNGKLKKKKREKQQIALLISIICKKKEKTHVYVVVANGNVGIVERKHYGRFIEIGLKTRYSQLGGRRGEK